MGIEDGNKDSNKNNQTTTQSTTMGSAFAAAGQTQAKQAPKQGGFSFRNMANMTRSAMGRTPASEVLSKLTKALSLVYEESGDKNFEITPIAIDMNSTISLGVSILVIALRDKTALDAGVAYHTLILEASAEAPAPRFETINGINTEIIRSIGEAYDKEMIAVAAEAVAKAFPQSRQLPISACVVPRDFNLADQQAVYQLAANTIFACSSELETSYNGFQDLNLNNAMNDSYLTVRTTFGNPQINNATNQPIRSDIVIDFSAAPINQGGQQPQQTVERVSSIARISGFMDLVWDPAQMPQNIYYQPTQQNSFQRYAARFVGTALESTSLLTIPAQLLALLPALSLRENNQWVQAFRSHGFSDGVDMHDIGAIGIEVNFDNAPSGFGSRIDTRADSFKPEHLHKLIASTVRPGLILSLDVPECGPETWYNEVFSAAASGHPGANKAIIDAANCLTNGIFSKYFGGGQVALDEYNKIHLGHYTDRQGVRRDIRDIDYLAIMNLVGEKDPSIIRDWSDTFLKTNYDLRLRLAGRKKIITGIFSDVVFTGFARRVTFETSFIEALAKSSIEAGLNIRSVTSYADLGSYERATAGFAGQTLMSGDMTGLFNRGGLGNATPMGGYRSFTNRWSA